MHREARASNNTVIPNQFAFLVWESPSNSWKLFVIQFVLSCRSLVSIHEKWYVYPGDCHTSLRTGSQ